MDPTEANIHFQIASTIALGGGIFVLCWYLSNAGMLEIASTAMTFFIMQLGRLSGSSVAKRVPCEFRETGEFIDTARRNYATWVSNRKLLSHLILAALATIVFVGCRFLASGVMTVIASPLLAIALGLVITAFVISPALFRGMIDSFKDRFGTQPDAGEGQSAAGQP